MFTQEPDEIGGCMVMMEIMPFLKLYPHLIDHPLHQYQHNSRSRAQGAHFTTLNVWGWDFSKLVLSFPSPLTESLLCHRAQWASCHCHGIHLAWNFQREGNSTNSGPTCSLHNDGSFSKHMSGSMHLFNQCIPGIHSIQSHLERKYVFEKDPLPK